MAWRNSVETLGPPSLWFYGESDKIFPEWVWRADYEHFTKAGGKARLVDFGAVNDAHNLLGQSEYLNLWISQGRRLPWRARPSQQGGLS